jgi:hypothetical protein
MMVNEPGFGHKLTLDELQLECYAHVCVKYYNISILVNMKG